MRFSTLPHGPLCVYVFRTATVAAATLVLAVVPTRICAQLASPGFELGPAAAVTSFPQAANSMSWQASHTDGERFQTTGPRPAFSGSYYASLLQNAGQGPATAQPFGSFGSTGYDRIYDTFSVLPNTTYNVGFYHAGDDRFGYFADTTVITVGAANNSAVFAHVLTPTPSLFNWTPYSFQFTTDAVTTLAAIAFTTRGANHSSVLIDDVGVAIIPEPSTVAVFAVVAVPAMGRWRRRG